MELASLGDWERRSRALDSNMTMDLSISIGVLIVENCYRRADRAFATLCNGKLTQILLTIAYSAISSIIRMLTDSSVHLTESRLESQIGRHKH